MIIDDEPKFCAFAEKAAAQLGFETRCVTDSARVFDELETFSPTVVMLDLKMPGYDGIQLLSGLKGRGCKARVIVVSGMDQRTLNTTEKLAQSHGLAIVGALQKPIRLGDLRAALRSAIADGLRYTSDELRKAIDADQLTVHYQPRISRANGAWSIDGAEALVRWQHPTDGLVMPDSFITLAEESNLIGALTDHVMRATVRQLAEWRKLGLQLKIAVNLSARLIADLDFPDRLRQLLEVHGVPGSSITLELTESAAMADPSKAMDIFLRLRINDVGLAIDDFGTGFSSLKQLYELPFDELKIDRTFVTALPDNDQARTIIRATVDMAHALKMSVCAEGVETRGALEYLEQVGCDRAQGYLISRAVPAREFEQLVGPWSRQALQRVAQQG